MGYTARATTGVLGQRLVAGFDLADVFVDNMGEPIQVWEREVSYKGTTTLDTIIYADEIWEDMSAEERKESRQTFKDYNKLNMLAHILYRDEKVKLDSEVSYYMSGDIREIRVGKLSYRCKGNKYYGTNKKPVIDKIDEEE